MANIPATTEMELLIQVNADVSAMKSDFTAAVDRLRDTVERLATSFNRMEEQKISVMQREIDELKAWKQEIKGGWKLAVVIWTVFIGLIVAAVKYFSK